MRFLYPYTVETAEDGVTITFPDLPEAITGVAEEVRAPAAARDCLEEAIASRMLAGEDIPHPSPASSRGGRSAKAAPGALIAAKAALYDAMRAEGVKKTDLARTLGVAEGEVRRMLDPRHATKIGRLEDALATFSRQLIVAAVEV